MSQLLSMISRAALQYCNAQCFLAVVDGELCCQHDKEIVCGYTFG